MNVEQWSPPSKYLSTDYALKNLSHSNPYYCATGNEYDQVVNDILKQNSKNDADWLRHK